MAKLNLTARSVAALKPKPERVYYFDTNLPGFCISVTTKGVKTFSVMYRHGRRLRRYTIGTTDRWSLVAARDEARDALRAAAKGEDPAAQKKEERTAETFGELAADYMERWAKKRKKSWREDQRIINRYFLPRFEHIRAADVKRRDVRAMLEEMGETVMANRVLACMRKIYNWAIGVDLVDSNPCLNIPKPARDTSRTRVLSENEIKKIWNGIEQEPLLMSSMYKLRFFTAQRGGEVASMRWVDIAEEEDQVWWTIPAEVAKNGRSHRVPITDGSLRILETLRREQSILRNETKRESPFVFYAPRGKGHIKELQKAAQRIRQNAKLEEDDNGVNDFRAHDLRRTAASYMTSMGIPRLVVGRILNHAEPGVTAVYDRHSYDQEKREALELWACRLVGIVA